MLAATYEHQRRVRLGGRGARGIQNCVARGWAGPNRYSRPGRTIHNLPRRGQRRHQPADLLSAAGEIYVIGSTVSTNFPQVQSPVSMGPAPRRTCLISAALSYDCSTATGFVAKLTSGASSVGYAAYYGGDGAITAIAVDASGSAYLVGMFVPSSSAPVFTPTPGAYDTTPRQGPAPFLVKLTPDGNSIVYATYLDGPPAGVAVDGFGNAIV